MKTLSRHAARWLAAAVVTAGSAGATGAFALASANASVAPANAGGLTVKQIAFGSKLHHSFQVGSTSHTDALTGPDDISSYGTINGGDKTGVRGAGLYVAFQNGVGAQGEPSSDGNVDSTIVQFTFTGRAVRQWDVKGKIDGLTVDPLRGEVIATVNEDANSSIYSISVATGQVVHYAYNVPLAHHGGTDAISVYQGQLVVSASAPGTTSGSAPSDVPAAYVVQLHPATKVATVFPLYSDEATAVAANGPGAGHDVTLALTDPDSSEVVPASSPAFRGDYMLNSQGDQELIFGSFTWYSRHLSVLSISQSVDDSAWASQPGGEFFTTDASAGTVDAISGQVAAGTMLTAVTPCNANSAPATCTTPNSLGTINLKTGAVTGVSTSGAGVQPKGLIFVPVYP
jgi:hypothetical protein